MNEDEEIVSALEQRSGAQPDAGRKLALAGTVVLLAALAFLAWRRLAR